MEDETRRSIARTGVLLLMALIGIQFLWVKLDRPAPAAMSNGQPAAPVRIQVESLTLFQSRLISRGVIAADEYLEWGAHPTNPACQMVVRTAQSGQPTGWLCSDTNGIYWMDTAGERAGPRVAWQTVGS